MDSSSTRYLPSSPSSSASSSSCGNVNDLLDACRSFVETRIRFRDRCGRIMRHLVEAGNILLEAADRIDALERKLQQTKAERDRLREVLEEAAKQSTSDEVGATDREYHDFEGAYDRLILNARATLHPTPTREGGAPRSLVDQVEQEWHDIQSAPLDGKPIWLFTTCHGQVEAWFSPGGWSETHEGREYDGPVWVCADDAFQIEVEETPNGLLHGTATHWRPLPAEPYTPTREPLTERDRLREAVKNFANPVNWSATAGCLQWIGKRSAIEYAESILTRESK